MAGLTASGIGSGWTFEPDQSVEVTIGQQPLTALSTRKRKLPGETVRLRSSSSPVALNAAERGRTFSMQQNLPPHQAKRCLRCAVSATSSASATAAATRSSARAGQEQRVATNASTEFPHPARAISTITPSADRGQGLCRRQRAARPRHELRRRQPPRNSAMRSTAASSGLPARR